MYRREFLRALAVGTAAVSPLLNIATARATQSPSDLLISRRTLDVKGRAATVFGLTDRAGRPGLVLDAEKQFDVRLINETAEDTLIHWHGLTPPWQMDGVPGNPAALLKAKEDRRYDFPIGRGGTHWMHAHTLQEQSLLAAPLIVRTSEDRSRDEQEVTILLHDFSFKSPEELLAGLRASGSGHGNMPMTGQSMPPMMPSMHAQHQMQMGGNSGMAMPMMGMPNMDLNDIEYDAYLANDRTLDDPEVVTVEKGGRIRLRIINGATATAFTIDTRTLAASLVAVDGIDVVPITGRRFPITMGQRLDIRLELPSDATMFPILALREGARERTGVILAVAGASITKVSPVGSENGPILDLSLEQQLRSLSPPPARPADRRYKLTLTGDMATYTWRIDAAEALNVSRGQRVRITMRNMSMMAHPMHLHGHHFQVVAINGREFSGAVRDTALLPPMAEVTVEFDAANPGRWPLHCHHLYHMAAGMMDFITYDNAI
ncbi:multicopper oxidase family protein [Neorhizobium sp. T25_13]|uniref:multicopper oxidase family protein n=1 Tax=Neorhizobium sp. T25_13 TaxID=2093830 RepID=UPI000CF9F368|nr:multicopper oxidase family protein [Neorhizobium sp. T25_13]